MSRLAGERESSALFCLEQKILSSLAGGYHANKLLEGRRTTLSKMRSRREQGDKQSCREGKDTNKAISVISS